jgi:hypothetical protein
MLFAGAPVRTKGIPLREGIVSEVWDTEKILAFISEVGGKKPQKNEVWYRVLFDEVYEPEGEEIDEYDDLVLWGDNLVTFGEDEIVSLDRKETV